MSSKVSAYMQNGVKHITISGTLEMFEMKTFKKNLYALCFAGDFSSVVVDMSGVKYIDSSGVGILVGFAKLIKNAGKHVVLVKLRPNVASLFHLAGLDEYLLDKKEKNNANKSSFSGNF